MKGFNVSMIPNLMAFANRFFVWFNQAAVPASLSPELTEQIYTCNAPGFLDSASSSFFARIDAAHGSSGSTFADAQTTNLYGSGLNIIAGYADDHGTAQEIFLEDNTHSVVALTDSLALYKLFEQLAPTATPETINSLLKASANLAANSLEAALSTLGQLYNKSYTATATSRDTYYQNLTDLKATLPASGSAVLLSLADYTDSAQIASNASSQIAFRYALKNLSPFVLLNADSLYTAQNADHSLDLYDPATGQGSLTTEYLTDRVANDVMFDEPMSKAA